MAKRQTVEERAGEANSVEEWDRIWSRYRATGKGIGRKDDLFGRVVELVPAGARVVDVGGGCGMLGVRLREEAGARVVVWDQSEFALGVARGFGLEARRCDLLGELPKVEPDAVLVATEVLEHLPVQARLRLYRRAAQCRGLLASVPNERCGPKTCRTHLALLSAESFLAELVHGLGPGVACRVERVGRFSDVPTSDLPVRHRGFLLAVAWAE